MMPENVRGAVSEYARKEAVRGPRPMRIYLNPQPDTRNLMQALHHVPLLRGISHLQRDPRLYLRLRLDDGMYGMYGMST